MDNEEPEEGAATEEHPDAPGAPAGGNMAATEARLRRVTGRKTAYEGPIVATARGWVSRDGRLHLFAARFPDFAVLTPDHLMLCSTGFFTRRPRRRVFREPLGRLEVVALGSEPIRRVRVVGNFNRPIRLELRPDEVGLFFIRELLARTSPGPAGTPDTPDKPADRRAPP